MPKKQILIMDMLTPGKGGGYHLKRPLNPPSRKPKARPRTAYSGKNKTETFYEARQLAPLKHTGQIVDYRFEPFKLILVHGIPGKVNEMSYKPDFLVVLPDRFRIVEVKANKQAMREDAWVKLKTAVEAFPWYEFVVAFVNPRTGSIQEEVLN